MAYKLSIVIPVYRDTAALADLLPHLQQTTPGAEIIVAAAGNEAACRQLCNKYGVRHLTVAQACRGQQLNSGAMHASAPVLWFLHADTQPPGNATTALLAAVSGGAIGGYFRLSFAHASRLAPRLIEAGVALRCRLGGVPYGDQGLFVTREAFFIAGGFADTRLFEEVPLVRRLRRQGRFVPVAVDLPVSPRRWQRDGWWRCTLRNRLLALGYTLGIPPQRLAKWYLPEAEGGNRNARNQHG